MKKDSRIYIAGHNGLVGSALHRHLKVKGYTHIINDDIIKHNKQRYAYNLQQKSEVTRLFASYEPEYVFICAAKVGGIGANDNYSADMMIGNLEIQNNLISACHEFNVEKTLFLGSSCIYPKNAEQPLREEYLMSDYLEETNIGYAVAKIAGITLCEMYRKQYGDKMITVMPSNLYGPGDNFNLEKAHVLPALMKRFHDAKENGDEKVVVWGSGEPRREFLYIDDLVDALEFLMLNYDGAKPINVGLGQDLPIYELVAMIEYIVGYKGDVEWDETKPDGTYQKLLDISKIQELGWEPKTALLDGIDKTYYWFKDNQNIIRK